jgi:hypothetical protein
MPVVPLPSPQDCSAESNRFKMANGLRAWKI